MEEEKSKPKKVCGFYVSDWHLTTMILPYIRDEIQKENKIVTISQNNISKNIKEILLRMNVNKKLENQILRIKWTSKYPIKYDAIKKTIDSISIKNNKNITNNENSIIICGNKDYIDEVNENLEKAIKNIKIKNRINIINLYDISDFTNISQITNNYEYIINTAGINKTKNVFKKEA